jgi:hypothetical protein
VFEIIFAEFERALAAARRYDSLRYGPARDERFAVSEIPQRIFEELYAGGGEAGQASRTRARIERQFLASVAEFQR